MSLISITFSHTQTNLWYLLPSFSLSHSPSSPLPLHHLSLSFPHFLLFIPSHPRFSLSLCLVTSYSHLTFVYLDYQHHGILQETTIMNQVNVYHQSTSQLYPLYNHVILKNTEMTQVCLTLSTMFTVAPLVTSRRTTSVCPLKEATRRAVEPS